MKTGTLVRFNETAYLDALSARSRGYQHKGSITGSVGFYIRLDEETPNLIGGTTIHHIYFPKTGELHAFFTTEFNELVNK